MRSCARSMAVLVFAASVAGHAATPYDYEGLEARAALGAGDNILIVQTADEPKGFKLDFHRKLSKLSNPECTVWLDRAHWMQDLLLQSESRCHFDNCAFEEGAAFVQEMTTIARDQGKKAKTDGFARQQALTAIGRGLHTIQDFYAHSNYVELMDKAAAPDAKRSAALPVLKLWLPESLSRLRDLVKQGLVSGTWEIGGPKKCVAAGGKPSLSHGDLAKDSKTTRSGAASLTHSDAWGLQNGFEAAYGLARDASREFVSDAMTPELLQACGGLVAAAVLVDDTRR